jgi:hypothetical protein
VRIISLFFLSLFIALTTSSCFVRTNRVSFSKKVPVTSQYYEFNKDSIQFLLQIIPDKKNMVIPFLIFKGDKKKSCIRYSLHGKGISAREYTLTYKNLVIKNDSHLVGKSTDPDLLTEQIQRPAPVDGISPLYGTKYVLKLLEPKKANLNVHLEFEIKNKAGLAESFTFDLPLEKTLIKKYSLFNPFK